MSTACVSVQRTAGTVRDDTNFRPGALREGENLIVVRVEDTGGDGGIWGDADGLYLEVGGTRYDLAGEWLYRPSGHAGDVRNRRPE